MKIYLLTDLEGAAGVNRWSQTREDTPAREVAKHLLTQEVNAAIDGILDVEPKCEIVVLDGHGSGGLVFEEMHPVAQTIMHGDFSTRDFGFDASFDGLMFIGQHAMEGTPQAPLCHTFSSRAIEHYKINGTLIGEFGCYSSRFGALGVPTILLAGDDKACQEALHLVPDIVTVATKKGMGIELALHLSAQRSREKIRAGAAEAIRMMGSIAPYMVAPRESGTLYELEIRVKPGVDLAPWLKKFDERDERTVVRCADHFEALFL